MGLLNKLGLCTKKDLEDFKKSIDRSLARSFNKVQQDITQINKRADLSNKHLNNIDTLVNKLKIKPLVSQKSQKLPKTRIDKVRLIETKMRRNKRKPIILQIETMLREGEEIPNIKLDIVDDKRLCSKATFYRYVTKIQQSQKVSKDKLRLTETL